jgi:hypothetical protein
MIPISHNPFSMSPGSPGSPTRDRSPDSGSPYHDAVTSNDRYHTPSPPQDDSSHDEYTPTGPTHQSIRSGTVWTTPSQRSNTASIATTARTALDNLYKRIYGQRFHTMPIEGALQVAHAVQHASKSSE